MIADTLTPAQKLALIEVILTGDGRKLTETSVKFRLEDVRGIWSETNDRARMEILKSVIWTSPDNHAFYGKVKRALKNFEETLD
jgi:hypothetical protein